MAFDWYQNQWHWMILNGVMTSEHTIFAVYWASSIETTVQSLLVWDRLESHQHLVVQAYRTALYNTKFAAIL